MAKQKAHNDDSPRSCRTRAAGDLVGDVGGRSFRRFGFVQSSIVSRWGEIVGERYAKVSSPESIRFPTGKKGGGALTLLVDGAHAPLIQHLTPMIVERVNRFFGYAAVGRVTIRQGAARRAPEPKRAPQSLRAVPADLGDSLRAITDPELRECLTSLAGALAASSGVPKIGATRPQRDEK